MKLAYIGGYYFNPDNIIYVQERDKGQYGKKEVHVFFNFYDSDKKAPWVIVLDEYTIKQFQEAIDNFTR